eukprot:m.15390 g.15390  ORF g.15390 m.15390 type:complete len:111 (-) comp7843_c0_seq3:323-655(-)
MMNCLHVCVTMFHSREIIASQYCVLVFTLWSNECPSTIKLFHKLASLTECLRTSSFNDIILQFTALNRPSTQQSMLCVVTPMKCLLADALSRFRCLCEESFQQCVLPLHL